MCQGDSRFLGREGGGGGGGCVVGVGRGGGGGFKTQSALAYISLK